MSGVLAVFEDLFQQSSVQPTVAAAATVLANLPPPVAATRLDLALRAVAPNLSDIEREGWIAALSGPLMKAGITASRCVAAFVGQCAVESCGFRSLEEDLNYSAARLCQIWPSRFPDVTAAQACALRPEILANHVYAERMGNGDAASGDGWRFRGRGLIQITGRTAYQRFANAMGMSLEQAVQHAATPAGAATSATWFWTANQLNGLARTWSIDLLSRKINGSTTGAAERSRLCHAALLVIGA